MVQGWLHDVGTSGVFKHAYINIYGHDQQWEFDVRANCSQHNTPGMGRITYAHSRWGRPTCSTSVYTWGGSASGRDRLTVDVWGSALNAAAAVSCGIFYGGSNSKVLGREWSLDCHQFVSEYDIWYSFGVTPGHTCWSAFRWTCTRVVWRRPE